MSSGNSFIDEINEEIRRDKFLMLLKKHQEAISWGIILIIAVIVGHSYWYSSKRKRLEISTTSLFNDIYSPDPRTKDAEKRRKANLNNLIENSPAELVPFLSLIRSGRDIRDPNNTLTSSKELLKLSKDQKIDIVWRDIATLIYVSYRLEPTERLVEHLKPLTNEDRPFKYSALETMAMIYAAEKNKTKAIDILSKIIEAKDAPATMKKRIKRIMIYLKNHENEIVEPDLVEFPNTSEADISNTKEGKSEKDEKAKSKKKNVKKN